MRRLDDTQKRLRTFALRPPRHSLGEVYNICSKMAVGDATMDQALDLVEDISAPIVRMAGREIIPTFKDYISRNNLDVVRDIKRFELPYPIGRSPDGKTLTIPVRPTFICIENERLKPYFLIGWSTLAYTGYQKELLSTIICRSLLTHQNFIGSDAQIVCFPRIKHTKTRDIREWRATLYGTLSEDDLLTQFERYGAALNLVARELRGQ